MSIREWIKNREIHGIHTFTSEEVGRIFRALSDVVIRNELSRLGNQGIIASVYRGFYVIIPAQYALKQIVPPMYYIDQLMAHLGKPYYVSLLSAAELLGAAHQRPQKFSVMTVYPKSTVSPTKNNLLAWVYRRDVPQDFLLTKNSETGEVRYSNPELTALDLVQYEQYVGGLSRSATVLAELAERVDFSTTGAAFFRLFDYTTVPTIQRLGYIFEHVLDESERADALHRQLLAYGKSLNYVPLSSRHPVGEQIERDKRWKIVINTEIEPDEI
jgi:predicted transcriptional regulator of viral defense system